MKQSKIVVLSLCALCLCLSTSYAQKGKNVIKAGRASTGAAKQAARTVNGGQAARSVTDAALNANVTRATLNNHVATQAKRPSSFRANGALRQPVLTPADRARFEANQDMSFAEMKKLSREQLADHYALMRAGQGISITQFRRDMEDFLFAKDDLKRAQADAKQAGLPVPTENLPLPKEGIQMLRPSVRNVAGQGGVEHDVDPADLAEYQTTIQEIFTQYRAQQYYDSWHDNPMAGTYSSALNCVENNSGLFLPVLDETPHMLHRETGLIGFVVEIPGKGTIINDGVNPALELDPQQHVIFYAADPAARVMAFVEERANLSDPHKYNMLWPRRFDWMPAEQPIPVNAGQTLIDRTEIEQTVESYVDKYYK